MPSPVHAAPWAEAERVESHTSSVGRDEHGQEGVTAWLTFPLRANPSEPVIAASVWVQTSASWDSGGW